jgi:hypothetical protein
VNKKGEEYFKVEHKQLEFNKSNVEEGLISFAEYLNNKYKPLTKEEYNSLENKDKSLEEMNKDRYNEKIREICDIVEQNHAGAKFKRMLEDMKKKLRVDEKIQIDFNLKLDNTKIDEKNINEIKFPKFNEIEENSDRKEKFKIIFKNSYHNLIISFFNMLINLKKIKQDFAIVFRFFGQDESDIEEIIYEYNCFYDCTHPRYCGDYGFNKVKYDIEKDKRDYRINTKTKEFISVSYRGDTEEDDKFVLNAIKKPSNEELDSKDRNKIIEEFYKREIKEGEKEPKILNNYKDSYLNFMGKLTQNCTFCMQDDYNFYKKNNNKHGKLFLIDPYDVDTLQIFFDTDLNKNPEKLDVVDVITKKKIPLDKCINKFVVDVEPYRAIVDINYFNNKIEECVNNRKNEILKMQGKQPPDIKHDENFNLEEEIKKLPGDIYLQRTVLPLLYNALSICEIMRPSDPIAFISNFMLINKSTMMNISDITKEYISEQESKIKENEVLLAAGDDSRDENNMLIEDRGDKKEEKNENN